MNIENTEIDHINGNNVDLVNAKSSEVHEHFNTNLNPSINGLSNGYIDNDSKYEHKSSNKDKHRSKDRDREHKSSKSSHRSKDGDRVDKHRTSSSKDKHRDKDKDKHKSSSSHKTSSHDKDRDRKHDKNHDRHRDKTNERDKENNKERDKEHDKIKDEKDKKDRSKDKERDKERNKDRHHRDKDKERRKEHKSSSHNKDKDLSVIKEEKDLHKTSSVSKDKHSSHSSSKSKDRSHHHSSSRDKNGHRDKERKHDRIKEHIKQNGSSNADINEVKNEIITEPICEIPNNYYDQSCSGFPIKQEFQRVDVRLKRLNECEIRAQMRLDSSMNASQASSCDYSMSQFRSDEPSFEIKAELSEDSHDQTYEGEKTRVYEEEDDEEDIPLAKRKKPNNEDMVDDVPLVNRKIIKKEKKAKKKRHDDYEDEEEYLDVKPKKKKVKREKIEKFNSSQPSISPTKKSDKKKKEDEKEDVWKWWEEEKREDGVKWHFLEHKGPVFAPPYEPLPENVHFYYNGKHIKLSQDAEEIAGFYARMLNHDYVTKSAFNDNFFKDWRRSMTSKEREMIRELNKCNFEEMHQYFQAQSEKNKNRTKDEKLALKEANEALINEYGYCIIDGHKERIANCKIEPPGLFRGRGEHPKMGLVKRRVMPEDISINCSKNSKIPVPPKGHRWKEVRHDNTVTWLASWIENVQGQVKYVMLNPSSKLKGEKDYQKYEVARRLDKHIEQIRATYKDEWKSKEMRIRQRGVALYFIDRLALRAGNEKDEDQADTVGCCSLRVEHVQLKKEYNGKENVVIFDFLGKDSIRYYNEVEVEKRVFKNLELFMENKKGGDDLFDRLNTAVLNEHLRELMEGLTAKVFRTYNASITLQNQLDLLTDPDASVPEKLLAYNRANRAVAVLCNHQRSIPKSHAKSMENLKEKIRVKRETVEEAESDLHDLHKAAKRGSAKEKINYDKKKKQVERLKEQLKKLELQETDRDENKTIALGTSKLNYLDPRISVAWCKKYGVPIEKVFNKTQREKFRWAIHMADENYRF